MALNHGVYVKMEIVVLVCEVYIVLCADCVCVLTLKQSWQMAAPP